MDGPLMDGPLMDGPLMDGSPDDSPAGLLEACSDVVLRCGDGVEIPMSKFACMVSSPVLRDALRLTTGKDDRGRSVILVSRSSAGLVAALGVIHGTLVVYRLSVDDALAALEGFDWLGGGGVCGILSTATLGRVWALLEHEPLAALKPHLQKFLDSESIRDDLLVKIVKLCIGWRPFTDIMQDVIIDAKIAHAIMRKLPKLYPPVLLLRFCLARLTTRTPENVLAIAAHAGVYYHPDEVLSAMHDVEEFVPAFAPLLRTWIDGMSTLDALPTLRGMRASVVSYHEPSASVLFDFADASRAGQQHRRFSPWLTLHWSHPGFDASGGFDADVTLAKIDRDGMAATRLDARFMGFGYDDGDVVYERWHSFSILNPRNPVRVSTGTPIYASPPRSGRVGRLRLDLFYGGTLPVWMALY